ERRLEAEQPDERDHQAELQQAQREREPARLIPEEMVIELQVERDPDGGHERAELERPPQSERRGRRAAGEEGKQQRRDPRLDAASQRVRHLASSPLAAYFAPTSVSAAGNAHCPATPARASARRPSLSAGTVESRSSTIQSR